MKDFETTNNGCRDFLKTVALGSAAVGAATTMLATSNM
jgi:hypothetical protein